MKKEPPKLKVVIETHEGFVMAHNLFTANRNKALVFGSFLDASEAMRQMFGKHPPLATFHTWRG